MICREVQFQMANHKSMVAMVLRNFVVTSRKIEARLFP